MFFRDWKDFWCKNVISRNFKQIFYYQLQCYMTAILKIYDINICFNSFYIFYEENIS